MPKTEHDPMLSFNGYRSAMAILMEILAEREKQHAKWGEQNHPSIDSTLPGIPFTREDYEIPGPDRARYLCDLHAKRGDLTWGHIAVEELAEVIAAPTEEERRAELVQLGAVVAAWIDCIDRRKKAKTEATDVVTDIRRI